MQRWMMKMIHRVLLVASAGLLAAGCGKSGSTGSSVTGSITYKGSPVTGGNMIFHGKEKNYGGNLGPDGKYTAAGMPPGEYIVTIDTKSLEKVSSGPGKDIDAMIKDMEEKFGGKLPPEAAKEFEEMRKKMKEEAPKDGDAPTTTAKYVKIPEKYANPKTSGLTVTVGSGSNSKDFPLTD
jgi:hypothetical protein